MNRRRRPIYFAGARRFSSSTQFSTTMMLVVAEAVPAILPLTIRSR